MSTRRESGKDRSKARSLEVDKSEIDGNQKREIHSQSKLDSMITQINKESSILDLFHEHIQW